MAEAVLKRVGEGFIADPACNDPDAFAGIKAGESISVKWSKPRHGWRHRKFFALLKVGYEAWEPAAVPATETREFKIIGRFINAIANSMPVSKTWLFQQAEKVITQWQLKQCHQAEKQFNRFRKEVTILAGYHEAVHSMDGSFRLEAKSIAFSKMDEDEFTKLYNAVCNVILQRVLTTYTREDLDRVVEEILRF